MRRELRAMKRLTLILAAVLWGAGLAAEVRAGNRADNFNRADGAIIGSTPSDGGSAWVTGGSTGFNVSSNLATSGGSSSLCVLESSAADADVSITFVSLVDAARAGMLLRWVDSNNHLILRGNSTAYELKKKVAGTTTDIAFGISTLTAGDRIRVHAVGDQVSVYRTPSGGGESLVSGPHTVSDFTTATKHGLYSAFSSATLDDFAVTDLGGGGGSVGKHWQYYYGRFGRLVPKFDPWAGTSWQRSSVRWQ